MLSILLIELYLCFRQPAVHRKEIELFVLLHVDVDPLELGVHVLLQYDSLVDVSQIGPLQLDVGLF